jgi:ribosomal protein L37E
MMKNRSEISIGREINKRRELCNRCEHKHPFKGTCQKCGCPILEMTEDLTRTCPLPNGQSKW